MTEPQEIRTGASGGGDPVSSPGPRSETVAEVEGRTWLLEEREDGKSWDLSDLGEQGDHPGRQVARITVTDEGYFSTDSTGKRRGPSVTLDGAVYPFEYDSRVLLDDDGS